MKKLWFHLSLVIELHLQEIFRLNLSKIVVKTTNLVNVDVPTVPVRHHTLCTRCTTGLFSCCCPSHQIRSAPKRFDLVILLFFVNVETRRSSVSSNHLASIKIRFKFLSTSMWNHWRHISVTLHPSSSLSPAGSGSVFPTPFVEWRPASSFSTYSA